jgi:hypothetical protein
VVARGGEQRQAAGELVQVADDRRAFSPSFSIRRPPSADVDGPP